MKYQELIDKAFEATKNAYIPYSKFAVGSCILLKDGTHIIGCNIENAAYGSTMCAERNAVYAAYCQGYTKKDIEAISIVADCEPLASPCGACRQVLAELLDSKTPIILANHERHEITDIDTLLPMAFTGDSLDV